MAKQQEFIQSFSKYDNDKDGQINQLQFINLVVELGYSEIYQGSVNKMIRKINYGNSQKETLNFEQAKEYYQSLETESKHQIFKQKYSLLESIAQVKNRINSPNQAENSSAAPGAAPGSAPSPYEEAQSPAIGNLSILVGPKKAFYKSSVDFEFEKSSNGDKSKPFIKINVASKTNQRAKQLQVVFKQIYETIISLFVEESPQWALEIKKIHITSFVKDLTTTFLITSTSEDIVNYIQLIAQALEIMFGFKLEAKAHFHFAFDYDFENFVKQHESSFYDIFTKDCHFTLSLNVIGFLKALKLFLKTHISELVDTSNVEQLFPMISLVHLQGVQGQFEFDNSTLESYELETKMALKEMLKQIGYLIADFQSKNIKLRNLIELLDEPIQIEVNNGQWKSKLNLRLKNVNQIFIQLTKIQTDSDQQGHVVMDPGPSLHLSMMQAPKEHISTGIVQLDNIKPSNPNLEEGSESSDEGSVHKKKK